MRTPTALLAKRLGLDRNPLRRRTDRIASYGAIVLLAVFLVATPLLSVAAAHWGARAAASQQHAQRGWHQVTAVLLQRAPVVATPVGGTAASWAPARWTAPGRGEQTGFIAATGGAPAGSRSPIWVDASGQYAGQPLSRAGADAEVIGLVAGVPVGVAVVLACAGYLGRRVLDRRALAGWGADWDAIGPRWTRQFGPRG